MMPSLLFPFLLQINGTKRWTGRQEMQEESERPLRCTQIRVSPPKVISLWGEEGLLERWSSWWWSNSHTMMHTKKKAVDDHRCLLVFSPLCVVIVGPTLKSGVTKKHPPSEWKRRPHRWRHQMMWYTHKIVTISSSQHILIERRWWRDRFHYRREKERTFSTPKNIEEQELTTSSTRKKGIGFLIWCFCCWKHLCLCLRKMFPSFLVSVMLSLSCHLSPSFSLMIVSRFILLLSCLS